MLLRERLVWVHPETPSPLAGEGFDRELSRTVGVRGSKTEHFNILNHYHPHPTLPEAVKKSLKSPPPYPPPSRGREFLSYFNMFTLSPGGRG